MRKKEAKWLAEAFSAESSTFSSEEFWKKLFSFRTAVGLKRCADLLTKAPEDPVKSIEQNLWTAVSRKADPADSEVDVTRP